MIDSVKTQLDKRAVCGLKLPYAAHRVLGERNTASGVWQEIKKHGRPIEKKKDAYFQPEDPNFFYCIEKGRLRPDFTALTGRQRSLLLYEEGAIINLENAILGKECLEIFTVLDDSILWRMNKREIMDIPTTCPQLVNLCLRILVKVNLTCNVALTYLDIDDFKIRFCRYLVLNMSRYGKNCFCIGLTQQECANTLGVHRATLARVVQTLKRDGILECFTRAKMCILDRTKLLQLAEAVPAHMGDEM